VVTRKDPEMMRTTQNPMSGMISYSVKLSMEERLIHGYKLKPDHHEYLIDFYG
jgi:hypothetical protein